MNESTMTYDDEITEIHNLLLQMLNWYHNFCEKNSLRYYVIGGTMLGAIRHNGFIPWDDDIDVGMPRRDYEKFAKLMSHEQHNRYTFETADMKHHGFLFPYAKIYDTKTTFIENIARTRYQLKRGIYLDVFPIDGIGDSEEESKKNYEKISKMLLLLSIIKSSVTKNREWYKNLAIITIQLLFWGINPRYLINIINKLCKKHDFDSSSIVGNLVGAWGYREIMKKEYFGEPQEYKFETITVYGVERPDNYLSCLYGDYMKLPPEEKRTSHHSYIYRNLHKSYLD